MDATDRELNYYVRAHSTPENGVLKELDRHTNLNSTQGRMVSGHIQGLFMQMLVGMLRPKSILEIGTFTGYSAISLASALEQGAHLDTIDINDEMNHIATQFIEKANLRSKITQHLGSALDVVPKLGKCYDLVFIDGDKREYPQYYTMLREGGYVKSGSYILADNVLWDGKVVDHSEKNLKDTYTQGILAFNEQVSKDSDAEVVILPLRDGMSIIRIK